MGTTVEALELDVNDDDSIAKAAKYVGQKYGRLDAEFRPVKALPHLHRLSELTPISQSCSTMLKL